MATKIEGRMVPQRKPIMLKEFLRDTNFDSSTGFKSFPGLPDYNSDHTVRTLLDQATTTTTTAAAANLPRSHSRSRAAAEAALTSLQKLLHAVKSFHYSSSPSPLRRSISRRFLGKLDMNKKREKKSSEVMNSKIMVVSVKVKDILRWKSFGDLIVDNQVYEGNECEALDLVGPVDSGSSSSESSGCGGGSSGGVGWVDSDFTAVEEEELPCCLGNSDDDDGVKKWDHVVASDSGVGPKEDNLNIVNEEDTEQQSPNSVLDSPFRDEELPSSFDKCLANMERTKQRLLQSIQWFESLAGLEDDEDDYETEEIEEKERQEDNAIEAKSKACSGKGLRWFRRRGENVEDRKECIKSMDIEKQWSKFEEESTELGVEFEVVVLNELLDELSIELCV